jgi:predicted nucleotidyltransferase
MQRWLSKKLSAAQHVADELRDVPGVLAVGLGGSLARGRGKPDSDIDLGIYYDPRNPPEIGELRHVAAEVDDSGSGDAITDFGGWGPWINGGAHLSVDGERMDWLYRDLDKVTTILDQCERGEIRRYAQPGHPHGFHTHIYLGEVHHNRILFDPTGVLASLKGRLVPYPQRLKDALISTYGWQAGFALLVSEKSVGRGESAYVAGCFFESIYCLVQVLFALNESHYVNEKGALAETESFELSPERFAEVAGSVLARPGETPAALRDSLASLRALGDEVARLKHSFGVA